MLEALDEPGPLVGILVGSESDREVMEPALEELDARGITHEFSVMSAHRDPRAAEYADYCGLRGVRVLIAGAGMAAALPGTVAAYSELPVIGVPLQSSKSVLDGSTPCSIVQMPPGVPVACVSVDGARNAAILAASSSRRAAEHHRASLTGSTLTAVIARYSRPAMATIWSDEGRLARWLEVELAALDAWAELGVVDADAAARIRERAVAPTPDRVAEIEAGRTTTSPPSWTPWRSSSVRRGAGSITG